jgi:hypothetical protein
VQYASSLPTNEAALSMASKHSIVSESVDYVLYFLSSEMIKRMIQAIVAK